MNIVSIITSIPGWALFCLIIALSILVSEGGAWLARRRVQKGIKEPASSINSAVGAMLGLLAFMLGFNFSITSARFADRKQLVIDEANAISTTYLRTSLLPEKQKQEIRRLLREYVAILLQLNTLTDIEKDIARLEDIRLLIWHQTVLLFEEEQLEGVRLTLFTNSLNEVMNISKKRETVGIFFQIPEVLWTSLLLLFALSMFSLGYQTGSHNMRKNFNMPVLAAAFALVIIIIAEMDSTKAQYFKVSQQPLEKVYKMMQQDIP